MKTTKLLLGALAGLLCCADIAECSTTEASETQNIEMLQSKIKSLYKEINIKGEIVPTETYKEYFDSMVALQLSLVPGQKLKDKISEVLGFDDEHTNHVMFLAITAFVRSGLNINLEYSDCTSVKAFRYVKDAYHTIGSLLTSFSEQTHPLKTEVDRETLRICSEWHSKFYNARRDNHGYLLLGMEEKQRDLRELREYLEANIDESRKLKPDIERDGELFEKLCKLIGLDEEETYRELKPKLAALMNVTESTAEQIIQSGIESSKTISLELWSERSPGYNHTLRLLLKAARWNETAHTWNKTAVNTNL